MDHRLIEGLMEVVVPAVREYVDKATAPLLAQIEELKAREPIKGEPGEPGKSITLDDMQPLIVRSLSELTADAFEKNCAELQSRLAALEAMPKPIDGKDGTPGERGADGKDADPAMIKLLVAEEVAKIPPATDGKDGVGLAGAVIDRDGDLVVTLTDGTHRKLGCVVGKDGERGKDGFGFDDLVETIEDGGRVLVHRFVRGEDIKEFRHIMATVIDRGVWKQGTYQWGDSVSHGGSTWIAQKDTETKPDTPDSDWRLSAKRGRDGKDFRPDVPREPTQVKFA